MPKQIPIPDKNLLIEEYINNGKTLGVLAEELDISKSSLQRVLAAHGINKRTNQEAIAKLTEQFLKEEYLTNGRSITDISDSLGIRHETVSNRLRVFGIKVREKWENAEDITGKQFSSLTATDKRRSRVKYGSLRGETLFKCECGNEKWLQRDSVIHGAIKSCGCLRLKKRDAKNVRLKESGIGISHQMFSLLKHRASRRGIPFEVTIEEVWSLFVRQEFRCAMTGHTLEMPTVKYLSPRNNSMCDVDGGVKYASLDRIDSERGYVIDNVQWVWAPINIMKWNLKNNGFVSICIDIANFHRGQNKTCVS